MHRLITGGLVGLALVLSPVQAHAQGNCEPAVAQVRETPTPDGATTITQFLLAQLLGMGVAPRAIQGWQYAGTAPTCQVTFVYQQDGARNTLRWDVDTAAGTVTPKDVLTQLASGY